MKLSVIIVNYNVKYFLEHCLYSVRNAIKGIDAEVFIVDNNSVDGSMQMLRSKFSDFILIENKENVGFAKANNQAIRLAKGEYILLLNPDTVVEEDTFLKCIDFMDEHRDCGGLGIKMIDGSGKILKESKRGFPTPWASFCKMSGLTSLFPHSKRYAQYYMGHLSYDETNEVDILAGAYMMMRKECLDKVGLLDEDFFMYGEDMDLSFRMLIDGMSNYYLPIPIIHYKGECTKTESLNYVKIFYEAMHIFYRKHYPRSSWLNKIVVTIAIVLRMCISAFKTKAITPISNLLKRKTKAFDTYIVSQRPNEIINIIESEGFSSSNIFKFSSITKIPSTKKCINIILDDRELNYQSIINTIIENKKHNHFFHIYSSRNNLIISPKKQR